MPTSMPRRWTKPSNAGPLCLLVACLGSAVLAGPFDEPHLPIVPRTNAEAVRIAAVTGPPQDFTAPQPFEAKSAGAATAGAAQIGGVRGAFSQPSGNMPFEDQLTFELGRAMFAKLWVSSPSSTRASDGLGPLYNARSCQRCHKGDGRGHPPEGPEGDATSLVLRLSVPGGAGDLVAGIEGYLASRPEPTYGTQLQDFGLAGHRAEARISVTYQEIEVPLAGGEIAHLRQPDYAIRDLGYGPLHPEVMVSPRVAPQMIGLGLLEAVPAADILQGADPEDRDGDGISGRANVVPSLAHGMPMLGRFGHKAGMPTLPDQVADAFANDIGISSPVLPDPWGNCTPAQADCRAAPHGDGDLRVFEVDAAGFDLTLTYTRNLAVPPRRDVDAPQVLRGKALFHQTGCAACHRPAFVTHRLEGQVEQSFQLIWPYSDLLLHDMGAGLADNRPEGRATGREWRTAPLWGIGLTKEVSGHTFFLHDGRARSLLEAILWHGGEAQPHRDAVVRMPPADRAALMTFLESL